MISEIQFDILSCMIETPTAQRNIAENVGRGFWKGPDVCLSIARGPLVIPPGLKDWHQVDYQLSKDHLFPLESLGINDLMAVKVAGKSRDAQSGIEVWEDTAELLYHYLREQAVSSLQDAFLEGQTPYTKVSNKAARPILLTNGKPLFRFYAPLSAPLTGDRLMAAVYDGEINFDGEEGLDWAIAKDNEEQTGVLARVKASSELWIPGSDKPFYMDPEIRDYRGFLESLFKELPSVEDLPQIGLSGKQKVLKIGTTSKLTLSKELEAELDMVVTPTINRKNWFTRGDDRHINSYLVDAGTSWPIKVEILSQLQDRKDRFVFFRFFSNK